MSAILTNYPIFERNQVLTSGQLNQVVDYLDQQNRLTRAKLIGMGVACGLELTHASDEGGANATVTISRGSGITSEGYLANLGDCITERYRPYTLPPGLVYEPFVDPITQEQDITLFELLTENAVAGPEDNVLAEPGGFLDDKVVLLFIECFDKDLKSCLGKSCDELGKDRILTMRKLLISRTDLATVNARTKSGKLDALYPEKFDLPNLRLFRPLWDPDEDHTREYGDFSSEYAERLIQALDDLFPALQATYDIYRPLLLDSYAEENPFSISAMNTRRNQWVEYLNADASPGPLLFGVQYFYDFVRDLYQAYAEFKQAAFDLLSDCCPDMSRFPKHLMLGEAMGSDGGLCTENEFRHEFVQPPIYNDQRHLTLEVIAQHNRMVLMLESFDLSRIAVGDGEASVKITPSQWRGKLSEGAIPWYYDIDVDSDFGPLSRLPDYWNYEVSRRCIGEEAGRVLSYQRQSADQSTVDNPLTTPLHYDAHAYSFFRVEGHVGKNYETALADIAALRDQFNLPFKIRTIQLDATLPEALRHACDFHELASQYLSEREQWICELEFARAYWQDVANQDQPRGLLLADQIADIEQLVSAIGSMIDALPSTFQVFVEVDFPTDFVAPYVSLADSANGLKDSLGNRLESLIRSLDPSFTAEFYVAVTQTFRELFDSLDRLVGSCNHEQFAVLFAYADYLQGYLSANEPNLFSNFLRKHPGIDHAAGVNRGGTFVLVKNNSIAETPPGASRIIGDFYLPYVCCGDDECLEIPLPDSESLTVPNIPVPPYERFAFEPFLFAVDALESLANKTATPQIVIDMVPRLLFNREEATNDQVILRLVDIGNQQVLTVPPVNNQGDPVPSPIANLPEAFKTAHGWAAIAWSGGRQAIVYQPDDEFVGFDPMYYVFGFEEELQERSTLGKVNVYVNCCGEVVDPPAGCYSRDILLCWGIDRVEDTLNRRGLPIGPSPEANADALVASLTSTQGFTSNEIRFNVLEERRSREDLLNCLGINPDGLSYPQMEDAIVQYQNENCAGAPPTSTCYTPEQLLCWGEENMLRALEFRNIPIPNTPQEGAQVLANSLAATGGFGSTEMDTVLEPREVREQLLGCLGISSGGASYQGLANLIFQHQLENCGGGGVIAAGDDVLVAFDPASLSINEARKLANARGLAIPDNNDEVGIKTAVGSSPRGTSVSKEEAMLFNKPTIVGLLQENSITFEASSTKDELINILFEKRP